MFIIFSTIVALLALWHFKRDSMNNMADEAADWLQDKVLGWISAPPTNKIDTHHHYVPSFYRDGLASLQLTRSGFRERKILTDLTCSR